MKNQDVKNQKKKYFKEDLKAEFAEAFEVDLLEVDHYFKDDSEDFDFDWEDLEGDSI